MSRIALPLILLLATSGPLHAQSGGRNPGNAPAKKVYCWDEGGRRVCGDSLPAEASGKARTEISSRSGLATGRVARAPTAEERAAAAAAAEIARKQAEVADALQRRDLAMVESYMTEADLRRAYGERTTLVDEAIKTAQLGILNQREALLSRLRQAGDLELEGKPVPKKLAEGIRQQHAELLRLQAITAVQQKDRQQLELELQDALARYRALKGTATPQAGSEAAAAPAQAPAAAPPPRG